MLVDVVNFDCSITKKQKKKKLCDCAICFYSPTPSEGNYLHQPPQQQYTHLLV